MTEKELAIEIQQLEDHYANCLAEEVHHDELNRIWKRIKELRKQQLILELTSSINNIQVPETCQDNNQLSS